MQLFNKKPHSADEVDDSLIPDINMGKNDEFLPSQNTRSSLIQIGRVSKIVGYQGWLRITMLSDNPERFRKGAKVVFHNDIYSGKELVIADIKKCSSDAKIDVLFEEISDDEFAQTFVGGGFFIAPEDRSTPPKDSYYPDELEGMDVLSSEGTRQGIIKHLETNTPSPYLIVQSEDHGEVLIPFRKVFIKKIDRHSRSLMLSSAITTHIPEN